MARFARRGMTLVELLVVIAIIAVLTGLLLPAILQARGAGRKIQCESNLKQLAQAVQTFHHRNNSLPVYWGPMKGGGGEKFGGWLLHLLPDMEQQVLYDKVPASTTSTSGSMQVVVSSTTRSLNPREFYDPIPASPDYQEGEWQQVAIGTGFVNGMETTINLGGARQFNFERPAPLRGQFKNQIGFRTGCGSIKIGANAITCSVNQGLDHEPFPTLSDD